MKLIKNDLRITAITANATPISWAHVNSCMCDRMWMPIIALTGNVIAEGKQKCKAVKMNVFLLNPVNM